MQGSSGMCNHCATMRSWMSCVEKVSHLLQLCHFASTTPFTAILGLQRLLTCMHYPLRCVANMRQYKYIPSPDSNQQCHGILAPPRNGKGEKTCILLHPNLAELNMSKNWFYLCPALRKEKRATGCNCRHVLWNHHVYQFLAVSLSTICPLDLRPTSGAQRKEASHSKNMLDTKVVQTSGTTNRLRRLQSPILLNSSHSTNGKGEKTCLLSSS